MVPTELPADAPAVPGAYDVLVVGGSAGGLAASASLLQALKRDLDLTLLLMLHLPPEANIFEWYGRRGVEAVWVEGGSRLAPGKVHVCPPRSFVELLPDRTCRVSPCEHGAVERPIDRLFTSVARSFGPRAIGVVLTGMGDDGAVGALDLHLAGGRVLVQSEATSEHPDMPRAAIRAGAAEMVVPLQDLAQVIAEIQAGTSRPKAVSEIRAIERVFGTRGDVARAARDVDWEGTAMGPAIA